MPSRQLKREICVLDCSTPALPKFVNRFVPVGTRRSQLSSLSGADVQARVGGRCTVDHRAQLSSNAPPKKVV